jgi:hypothetical protein
VIAYCESVEIVPPLPNGIDFSPSMIAMSSMRLLVRADCAAGPLEAVAGQVFAMNDRVIPQTHDDSIKAGGAGLQGICHAVAARCSCTYAVQQDTVQHRDAQGQLAVGKCCRQQSVAAGVATSLRGRSRSFNSGQKRSVGGAT